MPVMIWEQPLRNKLFSLSEKYVLKLFSYADDIRREVIERSSFFVPKRSLLFVYLFFIFLFEIFLVHYFFRLLELFHFLQYLIYPGGTCSPYFYLIIFFLPYPVLLLRLNLTDNFVDDHKFIFIAPLFGRKNINLTDLFELSNDVFHFICG